MPMHEYKLLEFPEMPRQVAVVAGDIMQQLWKNVRIQTARIAVLESLVRTQATLLEMKTTPKDDDVADQSKEQAR
eukprot:2249933-Amphidinium_carterae.1